MPSPPYGAPVTGESAYERWERRVDGPMLALAMLFLAVFLTPMYAPAMPHGLRAAVRVMSGLLWLAFAVDYVVRLRLAPDRRRYVRSHIPELLAVALPMLRPLRVLRVVGLLGSATRRAGRHAQARATAAVVTVAALVMVTAAGIVLDAERGAKGANITRPADALWWAATTVTTVGYGDRFPVTGQGRVAAVVLMLTGIALIGVVTASVAAWFIRTFGGDTTNDGVSRSELIERLDRLEQLLAGVDGRPAGARPVDEEVQQA